MKFHESGAGLAQDMGVPVPKNGGACRGPVLLCGLVSRSLLCAHSLLEHTDVTGMTDDDALHGICCRNLDIERKTYTSFITSSTAPLRFDGAMNEFCLHDVSSRVAEAGLPKDRFVGTVHGLPVVLQSERAGAGANDPVGLGRLHVKTRPLC